MRNFHRLALGLSIASLPFFGCAGNDGSQTGQPADDGTTPVASQSGANDTQSVIDRATRRKHHPDAGASSGSSSGSTSSGSSSGSTSSGSSSGTSSGSSSGTSSGSSSGTASSSGGSSGSSSGSSSGGATGSFPSGWLYTSANHIYVSNGTSGSVWTGRGVNLSDVFLCGYDNTLWMTSPDQTLETIHSGLVSGWSPSFVRISLGMDSNATVVTWAGNTSTYTTPMTNVINALLAHPNLFVLVTLRSDVSMIGQDTADGDAEATGLPSDSTTTPNKSAYPTGTDATYVALVDAFAHAGNVLFGLTNEPGGDKLSNATIAAAMNHAVGTIRAEEDRLGVPHHVVTVQGNGWSSDLSFYTASPSPITYDNVAYELHYYPGIGGETPSNYAVSSQLPVIVGEYGDFTTAVPQSAFYADMESKGIPNLAWDFEPYSNCSPDLLEVTTNASSLIPTAWGSTVQSYLLAH